MTNEELDRMAAEVVFKWVPEEYPAFRPTTDWADAGMILDRMRELGWDMRMLIGHGERYASFWKPGSPDYKTYFASIEPGISVQRAITIAAIRALGGTVDA